MCAYAGAHSGRGAEAWHDVKMGVQVHADEDSEDGVYAHVGVDATQRDRSVMNAAAVAAAAAVVGATGPPAAAAGLQSSLV